DFSGSCFGASLSGRNRAASAGNRLPNKILKKQIQARTKRDTAVSNERNHRITRAASRKTDAEADKPPGSNRTRRGAGLARWAAMRSLAICLVTLVAGCDLYFDDDDDPPCARGETDFVPAIQLRNPQTGECVASGGGGPCDSRC